MAQASLNPLSWRPAINGAVESRLQRYPGIVSLLLIFGGVFLLYHAFIVRSPKSKTKVATWAFMP